MGSEWPQARTPSSHISALFAVSYPSRAYRNNAHLLDEAELLALQKRDEEEYAKSVAVANRLLSNILAALRSAATSPKSPTEDGPDRKRAKTNSGHKAAATTDGGQEEGGKKKEEEEDVYRILDSSFARGAEVDRGTAGAILMRLTPAGLVNALAGAPGGLVDPDDGKVLAPATAGESAPVPTACDLHLSQLRNRAKALNRAVSAKLEMDMMEATPGRIVEMMCSEATPSEIASIRRRIYDTVVLGRGTNSSASAAALEGGEDLPVAARVGVHDIEKFQRCKVCGNNDQSAFVMDRKNGDLICTNCGTIATESLMHEGSQFRKFEGEEDRNHHGDAPNPLYSNAHNMSTTLGGMSFQTGAGIGGFGSQRRQGLENILRNAHAYTEMNISQFGKSEKKTRIGYKDRQKKDAFVQMTHVGDALGLHEAVVQRAKELFAGFRDDRELVQQFKGVLAACLCEAFDQLSRDGRQILKMRTGEDDGLDDGKAADAADGAGSGGAEGGGGGAGGGGGGDSAIRPPAPSNSRAARRMELHSANLAGHGGVFVDAPRRETVEADADGPASGGSPAGGGGGGGGGGGSAFDKRPAPKWDIDDCRGWLQEASKSIAKQWSEEQKKGADIKKKGASSIPRGTIDELEGRLIEHTLTLVDMLESELKGDGTNGSVVGGGRVKVTTPRVKDMGRLGIKWQHAHERGSGGKGGVGNNAQAWATRGAGQNKSPGGGNDRTAGQILILKSAKTLGAVIKDPVAGESFHRELRALLERQKARKQQELRAEAAQLRFKQMNRKPWLKARVESS